MANVQFIGFKRTILMSVPSGGSGTILKPDTFQAGDLFLLHIHSGESDGTGIGSLSGGWNLLEHRGTTNSSVHLYWKIAGANEGNYSISPRAGTGQNFVCHITVWRNVDQTRPIAAFAGRTQYGIFKEYTPPDLSLSEALKGGGLRVGLNSAWTNGGASAYQWSFPPGTVEIYDDDASISYDQQAFYKTAPVSAAGTYLGTDMSATFDTYAYGASYQLIIQPPRNAAPTLTLTSPVNNQTLAEGNQLQLEGTAGDTDNGNVVTVKYRINGGTNRAIASGVSDGSSPISFSKALTYSNKRLFDGSTDIVGADLAEGVDHTLAVWAEDDQGGKSAEITRKFRVIHNRPPVISGENADLGTIMTPPSRTYTVTDPESNPFTVTEKINGTVIRTFPGVAGQEETITIPHDLWIRLDLDTPHTLTVEASDSNGLTSTRTYTFTRTETHIEFLLNFDNPDVVAHFTPDGMPKRVLLTLERYLPPGSSIESVKVCNNALDAEPTWEDATAAVTAGRGYLFTNQTKTAQDWRIDIWVVIAKGTATERVRLDGFGGAFD